MKKYIIYTGIISSILLFVACSEAETTENSGNDLSKKDTKSCLLILDNENVVVNWTAFKLSDRVGVGGTFDSVTVTGVGPNQTIAEAAKTAQFAIYTTSVNSNNPERDMKIANSFFGTMTNTESISGKIINI